MATTHLTKETVCKVIIDLCLKFMPTVNDAKKFEIDCVIPVILDDELLFLDTGDTTIDAPSLEEIKASFDEYDEFDIEGLTIEVSSIIDYDEVIYIIIFKGDFA